MPPLRLGDKRWVLVPLAIYLLTRLVGALLLMHAARTQVALGDDSSGYKVTVPTPESPGYLGVATNWDGQWYRAIAEQGYPTSLPRVGGEVVPSEWAFTPGYPFVVRAVMTVARIDFPLAAVLVSLVCGALAVTLLHGMVRRWLDDFAAGTLVLGLCCFPAAPVLQVAYTESMALLVVVLALRALEQRHYGQLVLWAAVLAFTRPVLLPLGLLAGLVWLARWRRRHDEDFPLAERWRSAAAIACCGALVGAWPLVAGIVTGERSAFTDTMASWPTNKEFGDATVNWLTLTAREPLAWGLVVLPVLALVLWAAFRRPSRPIPGAVRWWGPVYMLYILAATKPSAGLLRYLLVAIFPTMPFLEVEASARTRADKVVRLVLVGGLAVAGLVGQYYWVMRIFTIQQAPDQQTFP